MNVLVVDCIADMELGDVEPVVTAGDQVPLRLLVGVTKALVGPWYEYQWYASVVSGRQLRLSDAVWYWLLFGSGGLG